MNQKSVSIIPANPGFYTVYDMDGQLVVEEPVIAWRITLEPSKAQGGVFTSCEPVIVDGAPGVDCVGVKNPDGTFTGFQDVNYPTLTDMQKEWSERRSRLPR